MPTDGDDGMHLEINKYASFVAMCERTNASHLKTGAS